MAVSKTRVKNNYSSFIDSEYPGLDASVRAEMCNAFNRFVDLKFDELLSYNELDITTFDIMMWDFGNLYVEIGGIRYPVEGSIDTSRPDCEFEYSLEGKWQ